jgi:hypothetical protein
LETSEQVSTIEKAQEGSSNTAFPGSEESILTVESHQGVESHWWAYLVDFAVHILTGTGVFFVVALPAVVLDFVLHWLEGFVTSSLILGGLVVSKHALFAVDLALFLIYLINTSWRFIWGMKWR